LNKLAGDLLASRLALLPAHNQPQRRRFRRLNPALVLFSVTVLKKRCYKPEP
jgi:hypothetical protein